MRTQDVPQVLFLTGVTSIAALATFASASNTVAAPLEVTWFFGGMVVGGIALLPSVLNLKK